MRIDMSEYQERHTVSRLVGAPPGYVGHEEGGQLTESVRRKPYSVVLFDEIEKGHPEVYHTLLQVLDDGRLTDNRGRVADFKNTIVIMTSNLGSELVQARIEAFDGTLTAEGQERLRKDIVALLRRHLRPEFLNRIDETVLFNPLGKQEIRRVVEIQFDRIRRLAEQNHGIRLSLTPAAVGFLAERGWNPAFGARPVKRVLQREITNKLAEELLSGWIADGRTVSIDVAPGGDGLAFEVERDRAA